MLSIPDPGRYGRCDDIASTMAAATIRHHISPTPELTAKADSVIDLASAHRCQYEQSPRVIQQRGELIGGQPEVAAMLARRFDVEDGSRPSLMAANRS
jgi:hypothetical protein